MLCTSRLNLILLGNFGVRQMQTADCRLQTADCRLQTADCRLKKGLKKGEYFETFIRATKYDQVHVMTFDQPKVFFYAFQEAPKKISLKEGWKKEIVGSHLF